MSGFYATALEAIFSGEINLASDDIRVMLAAPGAPLDEYMTMDQIPAAQRAGVSERLTITVKGATINIGPAVVHRPPAGHRVDGLVLFHVDSLRLIAHIEPQAKGVVTNGEDVDLDFTQPLFTFQDA